MKLKDNIFYKYEFCNPTGSFNGDDDYYGLNLKTAHGQKRWFKHQDFTRC